MEEKGQDSLTISDILDQLVKPPITQGPGVPPPRSVGQFPSPSFSGSPQPIGGSSPPTTTLPPIKIGGETEIKLPQLGKMGGEPTVSSQNSKTQPAELKLSIRTMADDLEKLKRGQRPSASPQINKILSPSIPTPPKTQPPVPPRPAPIPPRPSLPLSPPATLPRPPIQPPSPRLVPPSVRPMTLPPIPQMPAGELKHFHPEKVVTGEEMLPPFLGAPIPKKVKKPTQEKVQYGLIARIIGSGMTTGILITMTMAAVAYGLVYFFYLRVEETPTVISPTPSGITATPVINELETIFRNVAVVNFQLPNQRQEAVSSLTSFINGQSLLKKEFKKLNIAFPGQEQKIYSFTELMDNLFLRYPPELKNEVITNSLVLIYGQEELIDEQAGSVPKRLVFITEVKDHAKTSEIMKKWEQTMAEDLKELLDINPLKQATETFLTNERRSNDIRYKNFPLPDKSIDYSVLSSLTNHHYLIITNSRESMYSPIDKLIGL